MPVLQSCYFCGTADDVQAYAVVPPRYADSEADERTAVLCDRCKGKLMNVVQPLAEKLDAGSAGRTGADAPESSPAATPSEDPDDGITMNPGATATPDTAPGSTPDAPTNDDGTGGDTDASRGPASDSASLPGEATAGGADEEDSPPANYRKAMRLLSNREFPIERHDVEELLGGAYDMEREEIDAVLEHAIESGRFEEEAGTLNRA